MPSTRAYGGEGDALISIDADLQDDILVMDQMVASYKEGNEIEYSALPYVNGQVIPGSNAGPPPRIIACQACSASQPYRTMPTFDL